MRLLSTALTLACFAACSSSSGTADRVAPPVAKGEETATPADVQESKEPAEETPTVDSTPTVTFPSGEGKDVVVAVEIAADPESRRKGLMFREHLDDDRGMVFIFPKSEAHPFWMKNTYLSLDMIFIDADFTIVGIVENTEPLSTAQRGIDGASKYVVEVKSGFAKTHGLAAGTTVQFTNVPKDAEH